MHVSSVLLSLLLAAPTLVAAQRETDKAVELPPCVTTCYGLAIARANCDTLKPSCICGSNTFFNAIRTCLTTRDGTCTEEEAVDVWNKLQQQCGDKIASAFPSLTFAVTRETSSPTDTATVTDESGSVVPTMGSITDGPVETSDLPTEAPTTMGSITGPAEPTSSNIQGSQTSEGPSAPTETPNSATHMIPSLVSMVLGSFVAGGAIFFML
ncbi:hypothetical protein TWF106_001255 [Orbilia oligospora]|uniref:CFEM domain-containing protein n=1 Tax=Orbilia oligospora TaxID=2813651 RepID=A0A6G1LYK9_ORBOL|nr:hypothetical protein TWF788_007335 [Orbilia oligospora]KAF3211085.1 hypothetical protein TWF679_006576 [Orbilia oligospora]KAF3217395.1 hypothetical protein TWF191_008563 [Orbilia oligospora]KAF3226039.1 hypothetical protein TWF106_001255 [Orbilia oligospora]KAF3237517.1 hypothetical protein TWF192_010873 [Orbilia oligospora]